METKKRIKIGVMGCAAIAQRSVIPAISAMPEFELVAVASRTEAKAKDFAHKFGCKAVVGYDRLLDEDVDAVYLPLPTGLHEEWIVACLRAGKHVLSEKSLAMTHASALRIAQEAQERQLIIMENFMFPYHSQHSVIKGLLADNAIGSIRNFKASFGFPPFKDDNFRYDPAVGGGALLDAGAYTVKAAQLLVGDELEFVGGLMVEDAAKQSDIYGSASFIGAGTVFIQLSWGFDNYYQCGYDIWGSTGRLTTDRSFTAQPGFRPTVILERQGQREVMVLDADNHFENLLRQFHTNIQSGCHLDSLRETLRQSELLDTVRFHSKRHVIA